MTDHQFNRLLGRLVGIEHELKHITEELREYNERHARKPEPPVDPMGYTE